MTGWIINLWSTEHTREEARSQIPVFYTSTGDPVFEVWFWHNLLNRWFVMSTAVDAQLEASGVVYFSPAEVPAQLNDRMRRLERQAGLSCRDCGMPQRNTPSGKVCMNGHGAAPVMDPE